MSVLTNVIGGGGWPGQLHKSLIPQGQSLCVGFCTPTTSFNPSLENKCNPRGQGFRILHKAWVETTSAIQFKAFDAGAKTIIALQSREYSCPVVKALEHTICFPASGDAHNSKHIQD